MSAPPIPKIIHVIPEYPDSVIAVFRDGTARREDMREHLGTPVFQPLHNRTEFEAVSIVGGGSGVEWPCGADLSSLRIEATGEPLKGDSVFLEAAPA